MSILPNLFLVPGVTANLYLIVDPDGLTLIDAGLPNNQRKILAFIDSLGFTPTDLKRILITHADFDHVGSLAGLQAAAPARTFASSVEAQAIGSGVASRPLKVSGLFKLFLSAVQVVFKPAPARVDETLVDDLELPVMGGLRAISTPGHTPGHFSFYAPGPGVLFSGDSLICPKGQIKVSTGMNNWDEDQSKQSARRQAALGARLLCPGHGQVLMDAATQFESALWKG